MSVIGVRCVEVNTKHPSKLIISLAVVVVVVAAACGRGPVQAPGSDQSFTPSPAATVSPATETSNPSPIGVIILAAGELVLASVSSQQEPGYHQVLTATHNLPPDLGATAGFKLVLKLWDAGRPEGTCSSVHPISGCATVDWSDARSCPSVPPGGVFDNSITFEMATGVRVFFPSESGALNDESDVLEPET